MDTVDEVLKQINDTLNDWMHSFAANLPNILVAIVIIVIFYFIAKLISGWIAKLLNKSHVHESLKVMVASFVRILLFVFGIFFALGVVGLDKTVVSLMAGVGVIGLALGFAFKDLASNLISGLFIAVQNPFDIGDYIKIKDISGTVEMIRLRDTILISDNGQRIYIPNKSFMEEPLYNNSQMSAKRIDLTVGISYDDDLDQAVDILTKELNQIPNLQKDKKVVVMVKEFAATAVLIEVRLWIDVPGMDAIEFSNKVLMKIKTILNKNGFHIPRSTTLPAGAK